MKRAWERKAEIVAKGGRTFPKVPSHPKPDKRKSPMGNSIYNKDFTFDDVDLEDVTIGGGVPLQVEGIPRDVTSQVDVFFCCATCGKVFWEGKHFAFACGQFAEVLNRPLRDDTEMTMAGAEKLDLAMTVKSNYLSASVREKMTPKQ